MLDAIVSTVKKYQRKNKFLNRQLKLFKKWYGSRTDGHPDWSKLLSRDSEIWNAALINSKQGPKILIATSVGQYFSGTTLESVLSVGLLLRGAEIHVLLCDSFLPACLACEYTWYPNESKFADNGPQRDICKHCFQPARKTFEEIGAKVHRYNDYVSKDELNEADRLSTTISYDAIPDYVLDGCAVGEHALAGALRFYGRCTLDEEPNADKILRRYFKAALLTKYAMHRLFDEQEFQSVVFHHGIYVPQGVIGEVARQKKLRVVNWNPAYRKQCFIFSHTDTYHHTLMAEPVDRWEELEWTPRIEYNLDNYLKSRWMGSQDWIWFHERPNFDLTAIANEIGIDFSKPTIGLLTNVLWDAQLHYPANAFKNMSEWVLQTISYFSSRPEVNLLIRVHPAEIHGALIARQSIVEEIHRVFPELPKNIFVVPPESHVSTYVAMSKCDSVIIYGTKTGVELTTAGIPVIVAGEAWIRNKGITFDVLSPDQYFDLLDRLPLKERMNNAKIHRARKYAYHFFFRRMIPLKFLAPTKRNPPYRVNINSLQELLPGRSEGLDVICNGILNGTDFIYPAERLEQ